MRRAVEEFIAGRSLNSIVLEWQRVGAVTTLGNKWTATSLKVTLSNPRLCGWRAINGELVRDADGNPLIGKWETIITPEQWLAAKAIFDARKGRGFHPDGTIGDILPPEHHQPRHLLTGILRCGRVMADGSLCNAPLRITHHRHVKSHLYCCPATSAGGCGGVARRGDLIDEFISEAVLTKLEQQTMTAREAEPWPPSSRGESHPPALTEPCLTVSRYTALVVLVTRPWGRRLSRPTGRRTLAVG